MKIEEIRKQFELHGFNILDDTIKGIKVPLNIEKEGYKFFICYNAIYKTWNPKKWGENNPYSLENLDLFLQRDINYHCRIKDINGKYNYETINLICECGNEYKVSLSNLITKKQGYCPKCNRLLGLDKRGSHIKYIEYINNNNLLALDDKNVNCKKGAYFKDLNNNYIYFGTLYNAINSNKECSEYFKSSLFDYRNKYKKYNVENFIKIHKLNVSLIKFNGAKSNITLKCLKCGDIFTTDFYYFISNYKNYTACLNCRNKDKKNFNIESFCLENNLKLCSEYKDTSSPTLFLNQDGYYIYVPKDRFNLNKGQSTIFNTCNPMIIDNIKKYIQINNIDAELLSNKYISHNSKLKFKCSCGQHFQSTLHNFINGNSSCSNCKNKVISKLEKQVLELLTDLNIENIQQYSFDDCKYKMKLRFDFYLPKYNTCIECQGLQHYMPIDYFGGEDKFRTQQMRDNIKKTYCDNNNINLIYIKYNEKETEIRNKISQIIT